MKFKEIEFKYDANQIELMAFTQLMETFCSKISNRLIVSSYDDYFTNPDGAFIRYRHNNNNQELTIKRKTTHDNNNERIEVNMAIIPQDFSTIQAFSNLLGYKHDFRIYKVCNIYWLEKVVVCYYLVFDNNMKELNRFIEIEANEDLEFENEEDALNTITKFEKLLLPLGISPEKRLKKSLFEMYTNL